MLIKPLSPKLMVAARPFRPLAGVSDIGVRSFGSLGNLARDPTPWPRVLERSPRRG
jgi:hypothetical protein